MRISVPYVYTPSVTFEAMRTIGGRILELPSKTNIEIPEIEGHAAPEHLRWQDDIGVETIVRSHAGHFYEPLPLGSSSHPMPAASLKSLAESGHVPNTDHFTLAPGFKSTDVVSRGAAGEALLKKS